MASGTALAGRAVKTKNQENDGFNDPKFCVCEDGTLRVGCEDILSCKGTKERSNTGSIKRQFPGTTALVSTKTKKIRISVQSSQSPKPTLSALTSPAWVDRVQKVTPTVSGIEEVAKHLVQTKTLSKSHDGTHSIVALPTECTYEACTLLSWSKDETVPSSTHSLREEQLARLKIVSSTPSVHVYVQHHNIKQLDQILDFPKKAYATKQNPNVCCAFNESRIIFQRLADQFWPGPVKLYLPPQSFAPDGLVQTRFCASQFVGFRCPSHPLAVKVLRHVHLKAPGTAVLVGSPISHHGEKMLRAKDVASKFLQFPSLHSDSKVEILHGEERRETFAVPTCQFGDEWLELWIVPKKRTLVIIGKSNRDVTPQLKEVLRSTTKSKNRVICSVLQQWKVADQREK